VELRDYSRILRHRWRIIVACVVAALALAAALTWTATPQYSSTASIFVSTNAPGLSRAYEGNLFATERIDSYASLVTKTSTAETVAHHLRDQLTADELKGRVSASVAQNSVILDITATDPDPVAARNIAQAYAVAVRDLITELETPPGKTDSLVRASIVDSAKVSDTPVSPRPVRNLGLALILGLLIGVGAAVVRELLDTSLKSSDDIAEVTSTPIVATIGVDSTAAVRSPAEVLGEVNPWAEAFRVLRTNMRYVEVDRDQRVFVVSSSLPGEGKTTTAVGLAITLAMANERVVLVECDLRRPLLATKLGLDDSTGTTSVLIGRVHVRQALQQYGDTGLSVLTSGPIPPNPSELLQSRAMEKLLDELREEFEIVILDAPPLLPVTDAALLAARADGALIVTRHGKTTNDQLRHAIERLDAVDAKPVGVVINMSPTTRRDSGYGTGYGYGYGYGYARVDQDSPRTASDGSARRPWHWGRRGARRH
jgi:capsular exopolysaccharide synthesis family protein